MMQGFKLFVGRAKESILQPSTCDDGASGRLKMKA